MALGFGGLGDEERSANAHFHSAVGKVEHLEKAIAKLKTKLTLEAASGMVFWLHAQAGVISGLSQELLEEIKQIERHVERVHRRDR